MAPRFVCLICHNEIAHPGAECPYCKSRSFLAEGATPRILAAVFGVMLLLFVATGFYTRSFNRQSGERGRQHYESAQALAALSDYEQAVEHYRDALLYSRGNPDYRLGLALALYESERHAEALNHLMELRPDDPTSGIVNKLLGRLAAGEGRVDEAVTYYRTAAYGRWTEDADRERLQSRLELVDLLDRNERMRQLTAELLDLLDVMPDDKAVRRRLAVLLLRAQVADRASALFLEWLDDEPRNREALVGRAEAEFLLGNYLTARTHFNRAQAVRKEESAAERIVLCSAVIELDPLRRGNISIEERFRRSRVLVARAVGFVNRCRNPLGDTFVGPLPEVPADLADPLGGALDLLERGGVRTRATAASVEANILLAEEVWNARAAVCSAIEYDDEPLRLVLAKLSR